eukprot:5912203-Pleurochrysis_carterae.AAC.1
MVVGAVCLVLAIAFAIKDRLAPRCARTRAHARLRAWRLACTERSRASPKTAEPRTSLRLNASSRLAFVRAHRVQTGTRTRTPIRPGAREYRGGMCASASGNHEDSVLPGGRPLRERPSGCGDSSDSPLALALAHQAADDSILTGPGAKACEQPRARCDCRIRSAVRRLLPAAARSCFRDLMSSRRADLRTLLVHVLCAYHHINICFASANATSRGAADGP